MKKTALLLTAAIMLALTACEPAKEDAQTTEDTQSVSEDTQSASEDTQSASGEDGSSEGGGAPQDETRAYKLYEVVTNAVTFPVFMQPVLDEIIDSYIGDPANADEYCVYANAISVGITEVIIVDAKDGKIDEVYEAVKKRFDDIKENAAFYPGEVGEAAAAVMGKKDDIVYMICHAEAAIAEQALLENI
ncbi:MAG: DUF4358 domain-containing protein [Oscillospiraceae bacterium]|jgi:hypothetical protein|nr:DUF4358 domain-containing protein [Oscillospiraceae bacterium]